MNIVLQGEVAQKKLDACGKTKKTQGVYINKLQKSLKIASKAQTVSDSIITAQAKIITNDGVILKRTNRKITFWQGTSVVLTACLIWIAIK